MEERGREGSNIQINDLGRRDVLGDLSSEAVVLHVYLFDVCEVGEVRELANKSVSVEVPGREDKKQKGYKKREKTKGKEGRGGGEEERRRGGKERSTYK